MKPMLFSLLLVTGIPRAQAQNSPDATIQALLAEVRQLRLTLERSAVVAPKIQVLLQRMQIQNDAVARLSRDMDDARNMASKTAEEQAEFTAEIPRGEALVAEEKDPVKRKDFEHQIQRMKTVLAEKNAANSRAQARELEVAGRLRNEQAKLEELNERLTTLERTLEVPQCK